MICQKKTDEELKCPSDGHRQNAFDVYVQFAERFQQMAQMPEPSREEHFKLTNLVQQSSLANITAAMLANKGRWHKRCFLKYNPLEQSRLEKRSYNIAQATDELLAPTCQQGPAKLEDSRIDVRRKSLRASVDFNSDMCIFCQLVSSETLHFVTAVATGENFYRMANELQIEPLLTYLSMSPLSACRRFAFLSRWYRAGFMR